MNLLLGAASNLVTVVFNSDDYVNSKSLIPIERKTRLIQCQWVYERLKQLSTRLEVLPVLDLPKSQAISALTKYRTRYFPTQASSSSLLAQVYDRVGGRLTFLSRVAKAEDMLAECDAICK